MKVRLGIGAVVNTEATNAWCVGDGEAARMGLEVGVGRFRDDAQAGDEIGDDLGTRGRNAGTLRSGREALKGAATDVVVADTGRDRGCFGRVDIHDEWRARLVGSRLPDSTQAGDGRRARETRSSSGLRSMAFRRGASQCFVVIRMSNFVIDLVSHGVDGSASGGSGLRWSRVAESTCA